MDGIDDPLKKMWVGSESESFIDDTPIMNEYADLRNKNFGVRQQLLESVRVDAGRVLEVLEQDGPGVDTKASLVELRVRVSELLVREVLSGILRSAEEVNKARCADLGNKFFRWCCTQENYRHTSNGYHLMMKIFAACEEFGDIIRLAKEMVKNGFPITAQTFNIMICASGEGIVARKVVETFIRSDKFKYRPFKNSYNAILHCLVTLNQYTLIEWVYNKMLEAGCAPDIFTYNVLLCAKCRLDKDQEFRNLLTGISNFSPDIHTYNIVLHFLGKSNRRDEACRLLNFMKMEGPQPSVLHYTSLLDGLSRAGNLDECKNIFDQMVKDGCMPDVVCYNVMITGYVVAGKLKNAKEMYDDMIIQGKLPNVFTYHSLIRGFCMAGKFAEACCLFDEMESRGCSPNFRVYKTLEKYLRKGGKKSQANEVIRRMVDKGRYIHLIHKFKSLRRS